MKEPFNELLHSICQWTLFDHPSFQIESEEVFLAENLTSRKDCSVPPADRTTAVLNTALKCVGSTTRTRVIHFIWGKLDCIAID
jgi:hypothetical protein